MNFQMMERENAMREASLIVDHALDAADLRCKERCESRPVALRYQRDVLQEAANILSSIIRRADAEGRRD